MLENVSAGKTVPEIADIAAQCRRAAERLARIDTESPERRAAIHRLMDRLAAPDLPHHLAEEPVLLDGGKTVPMGTKKARMPGTRILQRSPEV